MTEITIRINGIGGHASADVIRDTLLASGVHHVHLSSDFKIIDVVYDESMVTQQSIADLIDNLGYEVG